MVSEIFPNGLDNKSEEELSVEDLENQETILRAEVEIQQLKAERIANEKKLNELKGLNAASSKKTDLIKEENVVKGTIKKLLNEISNIRIRKEKKISQERKKAEKAVEKRKNEEAKNGVGGLNEKLFADETKLRGLIQERAATTDTADMVILDTEIRNLTRDMKKFANRHDLRMPNLAVAETLAPTPKPSAIPKAKPAVPPVEIGAPVVAAKTETSTATPATPEATAPKDAPLEKSYEKNASMISHYKNQLARPEGEVSAEQKEKIQKKLNKIEQKGVIDDSVEKAEEEKKRLEKEKNDHARIAHARFRVLSSYDGARNPKAPGVPIPTILNTPEAQMEARLKTYNEFIAANPDANLPKASGVLAAPSVPTGAPTAPKAPRNELQKYMEVCKERGTANLMGQVSKMFPGFNTLPDGQKMLIMQGMNDAMLKDVNEYALNKFQEKSTKTNWLGKTFGVNNRFGRVMNTIGNLPTKIFKNYNLAKYRKEDVRALKGDNPKNEARRALFIQNNLPGLVEVFGKSGVGGYLNKEGDKVIADFSNRALLENASPKLRGIAGDFNEQANILAHIPRKDKKAYETARAKFEVIRDSFLTELKSHAGEMAAAESVKKSVILMDTMSLLAADPETSEKLTKIANDPAALQAFKTVITERGIMMGSGALARMGSRALILSLAGTAAVASAPVTGAIVGSAVVTSAVFGYLNGKKRARKTIEENAELAQSGKGTRTGMKQVAMSSVEKNIKRLTSLKEQYLAPGVTEIQKKEILSQMHTVSSFVETKLDQGQINFGSGHAVFVNQNKLMNALHETQATLALGENEPNIDLISGDDNRRRRLLARVGASRAELIQKERDEYIKSNAKKSMLYGALFASAGGAVREFGHIFGWSGETVPVQNSATGTFDPTNPLGLPKASAPLGPVTGNAGIPQTGGAHPIEHGGVGHHNPNQHHVHHTPRPSKAPAPRATTEGDVNGIPGRPNIPTQNEVGHFQFTQEEMNMMSAKNNEMLNAHLNAMDPELTKYFETAKADDFLKLDSNTVTNPESIKLLNEMKLLQRDLGTTPGADESVEKYYAHMIEYKNRIEMMRFHQNNAQAIVQTQTAPAAPVGPAASPVKDITYDDVQEHHFSKEEMDIVNRIAHRNRGEHVGEYFDNHERFLNKGARHFLNNDESDFANKHRRELHEYLTNFANETGKLPEKGWSINRYADMADEYYARKYVMQGNLDYRDLHDPVAPVAADDVAAPAATNGPAGPELPDNYYDTPPARPDYGPVGPQPEAAQLYNLNSLDHTLTPAERAWSNAHAQTLLSSQELVDSANEKMSRELGKLFPNMDVWNGTNELLSIKETKLQVFMSLDRAEVVKMNPVYGNLYDVLSVFKKADPELVNNDITIEQFMRSVYTRDEVAALVKSASALENQR